MLELLLAGTVYEPYSQTMLRHICNWCKNGEYYKKWNSQTYSYKI